MYKVITIDDEPMIKKMLRKLIDETGQFQVVAEAEDGEEGLRLIKQHAPDLIMTDIRMPIMDGLELLQEMERKHLSANVIILSGYNDFTFAQQAIRFGVTDYLLKPVKPVHLKEALDRILERLDKAKQTFNDRGKLIQLINSHVQAISENTWMLNEEAAVQELKQFDNALNQLAVEESQLRNAYFELLCHLDASLSDKGIRFFDDEETERMPGQADQLFNHVSALLTSVMSQIRQSRNWGSHHGIQKAVEYMKQHFTSEAFSMQDVADHVNMSPAHFSRSFKEEMGFAFIHYLTQLRVDKAKEMLADPDCKTVDIANAIGYADYPHFAKVFKKYCGLTPTEYRKNLGVQ